MIVYCSPDMKVFDSTLLEQFKAFASSNNNCVTAATVICNGGGVYVCSANSAGCGVASYCTTKSTD